VGVLREAILGRVFILYGVVVGLVAGFLLGGRLSGLATVRFRLGWLAIVALAIQVVLFSSLADDLDAEVRRAIYVASTGLVGVVVLANLRLTGVPLIALGAALNLAAIVANGGSMPADPAALAALEMTVSPLVLVGHSHVALSISLANGDLSGAVAPDGTEAQLNEARWLLNPGSVGQPRDGDPRAAYAMFETTTGLLEHMRVTYDVEAAQAKILAAGLPRALADRLAHGS